MGSKKPSRLAAPFRFTFPHTAPTLIPTSHYSPSSRRSSERSPHILSRMPRSPSAAYARPSPGASIKSPELNAPRTSQIQGMVNLNGDCSNVAHYELDQLLGCSVDELIA